MFLDNFKINRISEALAEIGKIQIFYKEKIDEISNYIALTEKLYKEYKEPETMLNIELENLIKKIDNAKKFLESEELLCKSEEIEEDLKYYLDIFDELVYIEQGLETIKNEPIFKKLKVFSDNISEILSNLYHWFYNEFEPYRLVLFNPYRKHISSILPEETRIKGLFPWYDLYCEENPEVFFQVANYMVSNPSSIVPSELLPAFLAVKKDKLIRKYLYSLYNEINTIKSALDNNPEVLIIFVSNQIDEEIIFEKRISEELNQKYPAVALELFRREKDLFLSLICGPIEYTQRFKFLKKYGKFLKESKYSNLFKLAKQKNIESLKKELKLLMNIWLEKCEKLVPGINMDYNINWYYERFAKELEENLIKLEKKKQSQSVIEFLISLKDYAKHIRLKTKEYYKRFSEDLPLTTAYSGVAFQEEKDFLKLDNYLNLYEDDKLQLNYKIEKEKGQVFIFFMLKEKLKDKVKIKKIKIHHNKIIIYEYPDPIIKSKKEDTIKIEYKEGDYILIINFDDNSSLTFHIKVQNDAN